MIYIYADIACAHLELHALHARLNHACLRRLKQRAPDLLPRGTHRTHTHTHTQTRECTHTYTNQKQECNHTQTHQFHTELKVELKRTELNERFKIGHVSFFSLIR